jgi:hypothetical protein
MLEIAKILNRVPGESLGELLQRYSRDYLKDGIKVKPTPPVPSPTETLSSAGRNYRERLSEATKYTP